MKTLYIEPGKYTPEILLEPEKNIFRITGNSFPLNPVKFYQTVFDWSERFFSLPNLINNIIIHFELDYFNTSSSHQIAKFFRIIEKSPARRRVVINWYYNDQDMDMLEFGQRFKKLTKIKFKLSANNFEKK